MARVFQGKVMIPGDKLEEYFKFLKEAEKAREPFVNYLESLNGEFAEHLITKGMSKRTAGKHASTIDLFIDFLARYTDVEKIEDITRGIANTHFKKWYRRKVWGSYNPDDLRTALRKFFAFLKEEKNINNRLVLKSLR